MNAYRAPWWLGGAGRFGGHAQTVWSALCAKRHGGPEPRFNRQRWHTPDGDFIDVDYLEPYPALESTPPSPWALPDSSAPAEAAAPARARPLLVLFHGLEGSSSSPYAQAFADRARALGWAFAVPHFRGCSGEVNLTPRAYHSGDHEEVGWMLERFRAGHEGPLLAVGVSLGGNALLRWAEETGESAHHLVNAVASVCAPLDLAAGGRAIGQGFNKLVYNRMFLASMRPKALAKLAQFPGLFDRARLMAARDLYDFDNCFTAPLHGFRDTDDYWARASSGGRLSEIRLPALVLNALNDPFVPAASLPRPCAAGHPWVTLWQPEHGGHVGFPHGRFPAHVLEMPLHVVGWLSRWI